VAAKSARSTDLTDCSLAGLITSYVDDTF